ncbi:MAG TPA: T9SS type A sorting domain-containing protein [Cytophagaceae bacterium]
MLKPFTVSPQIFCRGNKVSVNFETSGTFNLGNGFVAQLSNENGEFTSFTNLGSTTGSSIEATIPDRPQSSKYKIRIVSSAPYSFALDNSTGLTMRSNPVPTFTLQPDGQIVQFKNVALLGGNVIYKNTTSGTGQCEWNFGAGASIATFSGCNPPPVTYSTIGEKIPSLRIVDGGCSGSSVDHTQLLEINTCNPKIPAEVTVIRTGEVLDGPAKVILICPGATYTTRDGSKQVYIETGATFNSFTSFGSKSFSRKGSVSNISSEYSEVIYEDGASISRTVNHMLLCPTIEFDYSLVKCRCNQDCNLTSLNEAVSNKDLSVFPNPTEGNILINGVDESFKVAIHNAQGNLIFQEMFNTNSIDLTNLAAGFYTLKITDSNGVKMEKLVINK